MGSTVIEIDGLYKTEQQIFSKSVLATYDIRKDDQALRTNVELFEKLRGDYPVRREFPLYEIKAINLNERMIEKLRDLGFKVNAG